MSFLLNSTFGLFSGGGGGGGGTVTGANNGLSLNGTNVVLGNAIGAGLQAELISNRQIDFGNFFLMFNDNIGGNGTVKITTGLPIFNQVGLLLENSTFDASNIITAGGTLIASVGAQKETFVGPGLYRVTNTTTGDQTTVATTFISVENSGVTRQTLINQSDILLTDTNANQTLEITSYFLQIQDLSTFSEMTILVDSLTYINPAGDFTRLEANVLTTQDNSTGDSSEVRFNSMIFRALGGIKTNSIANNAGILEFRDNSSTPLIRFDLNAGVGNSFFMGSIFQDWGTSNFIGSQLAAGDNF